MAKHYLHETGSQFIFDTGIVVATATQYYIEYKKPTGVTGSWNASVYSSYSTIAGVVGTYFLSHTLTYADLDVSGEWKFNAYVGAVDGTWWGTTAKQNIFDKFE